MNNNEKINKINKATINGYYTRIKHIVEKQKSTDILYGDALLNPDNAQN